MRAEIVAANIVVRVVSSITWSWANCGRRTSITRGGLMSGGTRSRLFVGWRFWFIVFGLRQVSRYEH